MSKQENGTLANQRLCHMVKRADFDGYGFNLHSEKGKPGQYIGKVDENSPAEQSGLRQGDRIIEVNGVNIGNETHKEVVKRIKAISNEVRLLVIDPEYERKQQKLQNNVSNKSVASDSVSTSSTDKTGTIQSSSSTTSTTAVAAEDSQTTITASQQISDTIQSNSNNNNNNNNTNNNNNNNNNNINNNNNNNNNNENKPNNDTNEKIHDSPILNHNINNNNIKLSTISIESNHSASDEIDQVENVPNSNTDPERKIEKKDSIDAEFIANETRMSEISSAVLVNSNEHNQTIKPHQQSPILPPVIPIPPASTPSPKQEKKPSTTVTVQPQQNGSNATALGSVSNKTDKVPVLNLPMTAAEMRAKLLAKKKYDPKSESVDLRKKFEIIQKL